MFIVNFSTQAFWLPLLRVSIRTTNIIAGRMQAEKHRSALPSQLVWFKVVVGAVPWGRHASEALISFAGAVP